MKTYFYEHWIKKSENSGAPAMFAAFEVLFDESGKILSINYYSPLFEVPLDLTQQFIHIQESHSAQLSYEENLQKREIDDWFVNAKFQTLEREAGGQEDDCKSFIEDKLCENF